MSTEQHRKIRRKGIVLTSATNAAARLTSMSLGLVSIPLTVQYLGTERFGVWVTLSSMAAVLGLLDFGISNSVLTKVASDKVHATDNEQCTTVSSAYVAISLISTAICLPILLIAPFLNWGKIFNVSSPAAANEATLSAIIFLALLCVTGPLALINAIQAGRQEGYRAAIWQIVSGFIGILGLLIAAKLNLGIPWLVFIIFGTPAICSGLNAVIYFSGPCKTISPKIENVSITIIKELSGVGGLFLILQFSAIVLVHSNAFVITQALGPRAVAEYAIPDRLFGIINVLHAILLAPLWAAYGDASARGDKSWIIAALYRSIILMLVITILFSVPIILYGNSIVSYWTSSAIFVPINLYLAMACWKILESLGNAASMYLNGANLIKIQVYSAIATATLALVMKITLAHVYGVIGVVLANIIAFAIIGLPMTAYALISSLKSE